MLNYLYRACQKFKINQLLQLDIIKLESLCSLKIHLIKYSVTKIVLIEFIGIIYCIFIRRLTTTIIFINLLLLNKSTIVRDIIAVTLGSPQGSLWTPLGWLPVMCWRYVLVVYSLHDPRGLISLRICLSLQSILFYVYALQPSAYKSPHTSKRT